MNVFCQVLTNALQMRHECVVYKVLLTFLLMQSSIKIALFLFFFFFVPFLILEFSFCPTNQMISSIVGVSLAPHLVFNLCSRVLVVNDCINC